MSARLIPNLGAEERGDWRRGLEHPAVRTAAGLWRLLFAPDATVEGLEEFDDAWPSALGARPERAAFSWLEGREGSLPWLTTEDAAVMRVHDKAFAQQVAREEGLAPAALPDLVQVFDPHELENVEGVAARIASLTRAWPTWGGDRFVLKPRFGTSGRGRVTGRIGEPVSGDVLGALPRLAKRGGAIFEPWLERTRDLSTQLHVTSEGLMLLGTLEQVLSSAGVIRGHRGEVDSRGRVTSGVAAEEPVREAAVAVAAAARNAGFRGPCGVDAFEFDAGTEGVLLRPVVEFNARFTMGLVTVGLVKRALAHIKREQQLQPGERRAFYLGFDAPAHVGGWSAAARTCPGSATLIPLRCAGMPLEPALLVAADRDAIDCALSAPASD